MKIPNIDKAMPAKGDGEEAKFLFKLASETPEEETQMMLLQEALQDEDYKKWKRKNPGGSFKDYLDEFKPKRIKLADAGFVEDYADLSQYEIYGSGSPEMVYAGRDEFIKNNLDLDYYYSDAFEFQKD